MKYKTILADPPWTFRNRSRFGAVPYSTLSVQQLIAMGPQIRQLAASNSHLYLWSTYVHLPDAFDVLDAWGFRYIQVLTWDKVRMGLGYYHRQVTEPLVFAVRGRLRLLRRDLTSLFRETRTDHSRKPLAAYRHIEAASPGPRLELFARNSRQGWHSWGNEVQSDVAIRVPSERTKVA